MSSHLYAYIYKYIISFLTFGDFRELLERKKPLCKIKAGNVLSGFWKSKYLPD